jgi:methylenetetrahydrofolate dehydrogenase (NADP+)/methenyltetrahydrofolate cyclohydrolase
VHSRTVDIPTVVGRADIVVAGVGRPEMVKGARATRTPCGRE